MDNVFHDTIENSRVIAETVSDAIITIDESSTILFVNHAAVRIFGYAVEEMLGAELTMLMPEYLRAVHRTGLGNYLETGAKHISWDAIELPGLHKNGKEIPLELSFGEFRHSGRRFFTGIARDITKRKRDARRLTLQHSVSEILSTASTLAEASSKLLDAICVNLDWQFAALWFVDFENNNLQLVNLWGAHSAEGESEFASASLQATYDPGVGFPGRIWQTKKGLWIPDFACESFPRSINAARDNLHSAFGFPIMLGEQVKGVIELFSAETLERDEVMLNSLAAIGNQIGQFIERKDNERELVRALEIARAAQLEAESLSIRLSALQRITDATLGPLRLEQVISESLKGIREALHVDTVAILLLEKEGDELVAWAAQGLEEEVEQGVRIPVGKGFAGRVVENRKPLIIDDVNKADVFNPLLRQKGIQSLLGVPLLVEGRATGVLHVGKLVSYHFTLEDVGLLELAADRIGLAIENARLYEVEKTARDQAEAANLAKDEFLTILSHELRTPLTPIIGWIHMMQEGILHESDIERVLSVVNRNAYSLKRLINDLLDMSAILNGKMRIEEIPVSVGSVLEESVETMRHYADDANVRMEFHTTAVPETLKVIGDRSRLNQTFSNLIHNAIKFSPVDGSVDVTCEATDLEVVVRIEDQGEGIPVHFLPHVFEKFRQADASKTRSYGGLGLGLSLVKSFVEAHGGTVAAFSKGEGRGSTFEVRLPRYFEQPDENEQTFESEVTDSDPSSTRILIVEDQPDTLDLLTVNFKRRGYQIFGCSSADEALQVADREQVDILISDIGMPSIDGYQLIKDLRQRESFKNVPAIALTGYASKSDLEKAISAGFDQQFSKPIDPFALIQAVESLLSSRR